LAEAQVQQDAVASTEVETRSRRKDFLRAFFSNRLAIVGTAVMAVFVLMAVFAPLVAPYDPLDQDLPQKFDGPSLAHPFGQDELGRDILSRVIYGAEPPARNRHRFHPRPLPTERDACHRHRFHTPDRPRRPVRRDQRPRT
jgi:hypothetical protein